MAKRLIYKEVQNSYGVFTRKYVTNMKVPKSEIKSSDSLNQLMRNWIISNLKNKSIVPDMKIKNGNSQQFLKFVKKLKSNIVIYEKVKQVLDANYVSWQSKARKVELIINTNKFLKMEYTKLMSLYLKQHNIYENVTCNSNLQSCFVIVAIISLI